MAAPTLYQYQSSQDTSITGRASRIVSQSSPSVSSSPTVGGEQPHEGDDPEDVLFDSLQTLYDFSPITFTSAGGSYTYTHAESSLSRSIEITLRTPDTDAANWSLHASSVWVASAQLARGVNFLRIDHHLRRIRSGDDSTGIYAGRRLKVLELGASAGLPSILIAKIFPHISVVASDYPDSRLIETLAQNIKNNDADANCRAVPYGWGSDPSPLFSSEKVDESDTGFDIVIAADTLWNPELHLIFVDALQQTLIKDPDSRAHLVAGLHTGRYTIDSFLRTVTRAGFRIVEVVEREVSTGSGGSAVQMREWDVTRAEHEEEKDRRKWVVWIEICWEESSISL